MPVRARAAAGSGRARHGDQRFLAVFVGQAVPLRGLPQASPQGDAAHDQCTKCKGVAYCSKDCQVCVASHPACVLSRPRAQETHNTDNDCSNGGSIVEAYKLTYLSFRVFRSHQENAPFGPFA